MMLGKGDISARLVSPDEFLGKKSDMPPPGAQFPQEPRSHSRAKPPQALPDRSHSSTSRPRDNAPSNSAIQPGPPRQDAEERPAIGGTQQPPAKPGPPVKEQLFDRGVIGDIAKRNLESKESEKKDKTFTFDTKQYRFLIYNQRLKQRIESIWVYPRDAAAQGIYGDLIIRFTILQNGTLGSVELIRTSGHKSLDDAAIKALKDGAPYWPLPKEWGMDSYTIEGLFIYTLYGYYIM